METITYRDTGVDRDLADQFVGDIKSILKKASSRRVVSQIGGYASLFKLDERRFLASSTDGVGTKLKLAFELEKHTTVGKDLVAMSVNDLLCVGAEPLFFLDYMATGLLDRSVARDVLIGIAEGCKEGMCALVGGETAEMPGFYSPGEYDLAGFAVGLVNKSKVLPAKNVQAGDVLIGLGSSGFHSNGFSLVRKVLAETGELQTMGPKLLEPTRIYSKVILGLLDVGGVKAMAHITGAGFMNVPRISNRFSYEIELPAMADTPEVYSWLSQTERVKWSEMTQTFNMGVGMVLAVNPKKLKAIESYLKRKKEKFWILGQIVKKRPKSGSQIFLKQDQQNVVLDYDG